MLIGMRLYVIFSEIARPDINIANNIAPLISALLFTNLFLSMLILLNSEAIALPTQGK